MVSSVHKGFFSLDDKGFPVETVARVEEALRALSGKDPNPVLLDVGPPGIDVFTAGRRIEMLHEGAVKLMTAITDYIRAIIPFVGELSNNQDRRGNEDGPATGNFGLAVLGGAARGPEAGLVFPASRKLEASRCLEFQKNLSTCLHRQFLSLMASLAGLRLKNR